MPRFKFLPLDSRLARWVTVVCVLLILVGAGTAAGQSVSINETFGGEEWAWFDSIVQTSDGGYALAGHMSGVWLVKTDASGNEEWNRTYGGEASENVDSLVQTSDGGYALAGSSVPPESEGNTWDNSTMWFAKTDSEGNEEWNRTFRRKGDDRAESLIQTSDGGYALAGWTAPPYSGERYDSMPNTSAWLIKMDSEGNVEINRTYDRGKAEMVHSIVQTSDGGYALAGGTAQSSKILLDAWLIKTDASGNEEWNKTYRRDNDNSTVDVVYSVIHTSDGEYALAGRTDTGEGDKGWLIKTDMEGNEEWNNTFGADGSVDSAIQTSDGGYALAGETRSKEITGGSGGVADAWLIKTDSEGNEMWNETFGGSTTDIARSVVQTSENGYALAGETGSFGSGGRDGWLLNVSMGFTRPLLGKFEGAPRNTGELHPTLYEDLDGDGDGVEIGPAIEVFGEIFRRNLNGKQGLGLTPRQAEKLAWDDSSPSDTVTMGDMISLFGEKFNRATEKNQIE